MSAPDPFDACGACGHRRRCHDSAGCGKWVEAEIFNSWKLDGGGSYGIPEARIMPAHTCPCRGFEEVSS